MENMTKTKDYAAARYVDILSDSGFKAVFGDAANKHIVKDFLNALLPDGRKINTLEYSTTEIPGMTLANKSVRLDLRCTSEDGTTFIIEMQCYDQRNFFKRCVSYASKVYSLQSEMGDRNKYDIPPVYMVGILGKDFTMETDPPKDKHTFYYEFMEKDTGRVVCETISIIFVELRHFDKPLSAEEPTLTRINDGDGEEVALLCGTEVISVLALGFSEGGASGGGVQALLRGCGDSAFRPGQTRKVHKRDVYTG